MADLSDTPFLIYILYTLCIINSIHYLFLIRCMNLEEKKIQIKLIIYDSNNELNPKKTLDRLNSC